MKTLFISGARWLSVSDTLPVSLLLQEQKQNISAIAIAKEKFMFIPDIFYVKEPTIASNIQHPTSSIQHPVSSSFHFFNYLFQIFANFRNRFAPSLHVPI